MDAKQFRKKPVVIEAVQYDGRNGAEIAAWASDADIIEGTGTRVGKLFVSTLEGTMAADVGDWIIKGVAGEFYPCKDEIFKQTYEEVEHVSWKEAIQTEEETYQRLKAEIDEGLQSEIDYETMWNALKKHLDNHQRNLLFYPTDQYDSYDRAVYSIEVQFVDSVRKLMKDLEEI